MLRIDVSTASWTAVFGLHKRVVRLDMNVSAAWESKTVLLLGDCIVDASRSADSCFFFIASKIASRVLLTSHTLPSCFA